MTKDYGLTAEQEALLNAIGKYDSVKKAAMALGISYAAAKQRLYRVRQRFSETEKWLKAIEKLDVDAILDKIPDCQNCCFLQGDGTCLNSDEIIDVNGCDRPCAFWKHGSSKRQPLFPKERLVGKDKVQL